MVAVGVNKSAEQFEILDERTRDDMAEGKFHDQRRSSYGTPPAVTGAWPQADQPHRDTRRPAATRGR